jgi:hypothetical protein
MLSVMSAFRFVEQFAKEGLLDSGSNVLRVVRSKELMNRWLAASQRRVAEIPIRWVLHKGRKALANALRSYESAGSLHFREAERPEGCVSSPRPRLCLGLLEAAEALGIGFVRGYGLANSRFHTLLFGINRLRSDELPHCWAKSPCSGAFVQLLCNQHFNALPCRSTPFTTVNYGESYGF